MTQPMARVVPVPRVAPLLWGSAGERLISGCCSCSGSASTSYSPTPTYGREGLPRMSGFSVRNLAWDVLLGKRCR